MEMLVDQKAHHIQDALEKYAVAKLQGIVEERGVASRETAELVMEEFREYATERELTADDFETGKYARYKSNLDNHLPVFVSESQTAAVALEVFFGGVIACVRGSSPYN